MLTASIGGLVYKIEGSTTLNNWALDASVLEISPAVSAGKPVLARTYRTFRLVLPPNATSTGFLRATVSSIP